MVSTASLYAESSFGADYHENFVPGIGKTQPVGEEKLDGSVVPMGPPKKSDVNTSLLYNEYIVYDVAQVQVKYLMKVNFKFKY